MPCSPTWPTRPGAAADAAKAFVQKLNTIEDGLYQVRSQADEDGLVYPPGPTERLSGLIFGASATDARPTAQMYDVFRLFAPQIQAQLQALSQALKTDLPGVNTALKSAGAQTVRARAVELRPPSPATGR